MRPLAPLLAALTLASAPARADVLVVGPPASGAPFVGIQAAVDAASDGDVVLVKGGTYAGFVVTGRALAVVADAGGTVQVQGTVEVRATPAGGLCLLAGLQVEAELEQDGLRVLDNPGFVRVQGCRFGGGWGLECGAGTDGGHGALVRASAAVAFTDCVLAGGFGGGFDVCTWLGGDGGHGLDADGSSVALYDCELWGGPGGEADFYHGNLGGRGGDGARVSTWGLYASGTRAQGSYGGHGWAGGDGGDGLHVLPAAQARLVEVEAAGGPGGWSGDGGDGAHGVELGGGGVFVLLPELARTLEAPVLARDAATWHLRVRGEPGDRVLLTEPRAPAHRYLDALGGLWLADGPELGALTELGTIDATGELVATIDVADLPTQEPARVEVLQALVLDDAGGAVLTGPAHRVVLDCAGLLPDCDVDGVFDTCAILADPALDADRDAIPDACTGGTSTWHVRPAAPPGGDGSAGAPFQTIAQAFAAVSSGDTVLLADGLYIGGGNRGLEVPVAHLTIRSENGPAGCILDPQQEDDGLEAHGGSLRIEGLRIRHARTAIDARDVEELELFDCILHDNTIASVPALDLDVGRALVRGCLFLRNVTGWDVVPVGNVRLGGGEITFERCTFQENRAPEGGALLLTSQQTQPVRLRACTFLDNVATGAGGAVWSEGSAPILVENCLVGGSSAPLGGFLAADAPGAQFVITASTFARCAADSGSLLHLATDQAAVLQDSIVWDQAPADGAVVTLAGAGGSLAVRYTDLQGGAGAVFLAPEATLDWRDGNLDLDPLFVDADGPDDDPATVGDNDWRLGALSPCLDAGADALLPRDVLDADADARIDEALPFDLDGLSRQTDQPGVPDTGTGAKPVVDLGAYERP